MQVSHDADRFRNMLAFLLIGAFIAQLPLLVWYVIPKDNKEIMVYMLGQLSGMASLALGFYFTVKAGEAAKDAKRDETAGKMADAVVAAANSTPAGSGEQVQEAANAVATAATDRAEEIGERL